MSAMQVFQVGANIAILLMLGIITGCLLNILRLLQ